MERRSRSTALDYFRRPFWRRGRRKVRGGVFWRRGRGLLEEGRALLEESMEEGEGERGSSKGGRGAFWGRGWRKMKREGHNGEES